MTDDLYIAGRINDSPAMAGGLVDLIRFGKIAVDEEMWGTVYDVNAFFMKKPGPREAKSIAKIIAYHKLLHWLKSNNALTADEDIELHIDEIE
jgi:myo-inositol-1-phosphate synthase